jgi:hypothetical protein
MVLSCSTSSGSTPPSTRPFLTFISLSIEFFLIFIYGSSSPSGLHEILPILTALLFFSFSILSLSNRQNETFVLFSNFLLLQSLLAIFAKAYSQTSVLNTSFVHSLRVFLSAPKVNGTVYDSVRSCELSNRNAFNGQEFTYRAAQAN